MIRLGPAPSTRSVLRLLVFCFMSHVLSFIGCTSVLLRNFLVPKSLVSRSINIDYFSFLAWALLIHLASPAATSLYHFYYDVIQGGVYVWEIEKMHQKYGITNQTKPYLFYSCT